MESYHGLYGSTSCCISQWPKQWGKAIFDTHSFKATGPILTKLDTHRRPPGMQTLTSIRQRGWSGRKASLPLSFFTRHSLVERKARYLFYCMFVCLFGQRFIDNPRADSCQSSHAGVLWFRMCLLPFWELAAPGGRKRGK